MSETISFPGLGINIDIDRVAFYLPSFLGGLAIYWYGILLSAGLLAGILYFFSRTKEFAIDNDRAVDVILGSIITAVIGSRLYFVAFSWSLYKDNLLSIFDIRTGGLAIYGTIIGGIVGGAIFCKLRKVKFLPTVDLAVGGFFIGQAIGRWGNFVNTEAFGSNTSLPWGMTSHSISSYLASHEDILGAMGVGVDPSMPVHPTFLYESLWCLIGFVVIMLFTKHRRFDGQLTLIYLCLYGTGRFFIEGLRTDSLMLGSLRVSQLLAFLCVVVSSITMFLIMSRIRREGDPELLKLYVNTDEGKQVIAGEFYKKKGEAAQADSETIEEPKEENNAESEETEGAIPAEDETASDSEDGGEASDDGESD